jgi:DNA polymerase-3 subunit delta'
LSLKVPGKHQTDRVAIIIDAHTMTTEAQNALLKTLEEPPARTVLLLTARSEQSLLPTVRSRVRRVGLKVPSVEDVAQLLIERDGIESKLAHQVAAESQSHIGMARRLATSSEARSRRRETLMAALGINSVTVAVNTAERWLDIAKKDAEALTEERDAQEKEAMLRSLGLGASDPVPNTVRTDLKALEESQKRRATRSVRDGLDRILVDLLSLYRDVLTVQLGAGVPLINQELQNQITELAKASHESETIDKLNAIAQARHRIDSNVRDLMALEALAVSLRTKK